MTACSGKALHRDLEVQGGWPLMFGAGFWDAKRCWTGLNGKFTPKVECSSNLLSPLQMERRVKFGSPQNISGASHQNKGCNIL